jgi:uncharacterized protein (DUF488 family)
MVIYTIGHSNHKADKFLKLLQANHVNLLVDVRSAPYSRYCPQFNKNDIENYLKNFGIQYIYAGDSLGGRPTDPSCYKDHVLLEKGGDYLHEVNYPEVMKKDWFVKGIDRLIQLASENSTAVMCSEENPGECHRHHLISKFILENYPEIEIRHIRGDGTVIGAKTKLTSLNEKSIEQPSLLF